MPVDLLSPAQKSLSCIARKNLALELLKTQVLNCRRCHLGRERIRTVFGIGNPRTPVVFLGEAPGYQEDHRGEPFVGRAGMLLTEMIENILKLSRRDVYISNVVKCHPMINPKAVEMRGNDRPPSIEEMHVCEVWWLGELEIIRPKAICFLGASAVKAFWGERATISAYRGRICEDSRFPASALFATYHPAAILRNPGLIETFQADFRSLKKLLG